MRGLIRPTTVLRRRMTRRQMGRIGPHWLQRPRADLFSLSLPTMLRVLRPAPGHHPQKTTDFFPRSLPIMLRVLRLAPSHRPLRAPDPFLRSLPIMSHVLRLALGCHLRREKRRKKQRRISGLYSATKRERLTTSTPRPSIGRSRPRTASRSTRHADCS